MNNMTNFKPIKPTMIYKKKKLQTVAAVEINVRNRRKPCTRPPRKTARAYGCFVLLFREIARQSWEIARQSWERGERHGFSLLHNRHEKDRHPIA